MPATKTPGPHTGRVALVTGASRGIGQATAVGLAEPGAGVVLDDHGDNRRRAGLIATTGHPAVTVTLDISDPSGWITGQTLMANGGNAFGN